MKTEETEPNVKENYFYWKGLWREDFIFICKEFWERTKRSAGVAIYKTKEAFGMPSLFKKIIFGLFWGFLALSLCAGVLVQIPLLFILLSTITLIALLYSNLVAFELNLVERIYLKIRGFSVLCPHCHRQPVNLVPLYKCPKCGMMQSSLVPGARYGAFYRVCKGCGTHLPTSRFFGRHKLPAFCSHNDCHMPFDADIENVVTSTVAFIGSPCVGKTCLLIDTISELTCNTLQQGGKSVTYPKDSDERRAKQMIEKFQTGVRPDSTRGNVEALCMDVHQGDAGHTRRLYFYDPPGEVFSGSDTISNQLYYSHLKVAIVVIDPFTIPEVEMIRKEYFPEEELVTGTMQPDESLNRWNIALERDFPDMTKRVACAVVINKTDSPGLQKFCDIRPGAEQDTCEAFLEKYQMGNMLADIKGKFKRYAIFSVSAQGNYQEGQAISPIGLSPVISWMLENLDMDK